MTPAEPPDDLPAAPPAPYPSLAAMREAHSDLLRRRREAPAGRPDDGALVADILALLRRGQASGTILDQEDERDAAQSLLTYWANTLARMGHEVADATLDEFDPTLAPALPDDACPYLGLEAFHEEDSGRFFGRDTLVGELAARLASGRLLVVTGPSGSGKSSVVRAGLVPALRRGAAPGSEDWRILAPLMPGPEPLLALARAVSPGTTRHEAMVMASALRVRPARLAGSLGPPGSPPAVLIVDQFEELFTLVEADAERQAFISALLAVADAPAPAHRVVLTMRSDFEPFAAAVPALGGRLEAARVPVLPMGAAELRQAIEAPAQAIGLKFEPGVVDQLVHDIAGEPAGLPLLQVTLRHLWDERERNRITLAAYTRVGGGRQALARSADAFYDQLIPEEQVTLKRVLLRMVRPGEGLEITSSRVRLASLYAMGEDPGRVERVVQKLIDERLLRLTPGDSESPPQVELAHEALVRNWPRLVAWLEDEKVALATRRRLELRADEWLLLGAGRDGLLDAAQLREAELWVTSPEAAYLGYSPAVTRLIFTSREAQREAEQEREAARQRELAQARALAVEQAARAEAERRGRNLASVLSALMALLAIIALTLFFRARSFAAGESQQRATAEVAATANASLAATAEVLRATAEGQSLIEQQLRATAEAAGQAAAERAAEAERARSEAERARSEAERAGLEARAGELAAKAQAALPSSPQRSLLLAIEAVRVTEAPASVARQALYDAVVFSDGEGLGNHGGAVAAAAASADGTRAATGSDDGVRLWDPAGPAGAAPPLTELGEPARAVALSADATWLAVAGPRRALLYPLTGGQAGTPTPAFSDEPVTVIGISPPGPGGTWLVGADATGRILGRRLGVGTPGGLVTLSRVADARGEVRALAFTPDGAFALTGGADRAVRVWDLRPTTGTSRFLLITEPRAAAIAAIAVSPDGRWVAIGAADGSIHIWGFGASGFRAGPAVKTGHQGAITALAFSPDGRWLLSGSADRNARLWPAAGFAATSAEAIVLNGHNGRVVAAGFSPDGSLAFTGGSDAELLVWELADTGAPPLRLRGHDGALTAALVADGRLLSAGADGQLRRWPFPPQAPDARSADINGRPLDEVVTLACRIAGRNLTAAEVGQSFPGEPPRPPTCPAP